MLNVPLQLSALINFDSGGATIASMARPMILTKCTFLDSILASPDPIVCVLNLLFCGNAIYTYQRYPV